MDAAKYIVISRQSALLRQLDVIANNIANSESSGFKSEMAVYSSKFAGESGDLHTSLSTRNDMRAGALKETGRPLDAAIDGKGYFAVSTPLGNRYTRSGNFTIDGSGTLVNSQGYPVQAQSGLIVFDEKDIDIEIKSDGTITVDAGQGLREERGKLAIYKFADENKLEKLGNSLFISRGGSAQASDPESDYRVAQGMLESSNVNSITEMTNMINVNRAVGSTAGFLSDVNDLERRAITTFTRQ